VLTSGTVSINVNWLWPFKGRSVIFFYVITVSTLDELVSSGGVVVVTSTCDDTCPTPSLKSTGVSTEIAKMILFCFALWKPLAVTGRQAVPGAKWPLV
jgi:hypothetical protein